ncbi:GerMN domain-containing protein [Bacillus suaedaesalsae]|uniref:GerMN domain-containing protein n=1 Tax=Bacillus suaedaesalsae TaxID=2810349 RepID=A0ABS2DN34_9BACI|nr:GerMN domain-containing protein [Bacillus suaedaesalsae]MBM6619909.1 GerMN domain-containing protein [Bacillus suaedaesalsae]
MKKSEWNDKQLEELLESMPKVSDRQSPDALYRKIQARLQEDEVKYTKKKKTWVLPSIATVAALFLIFLIGSNMMDIQNLGNGSNDKLQMEKSAVQDPEKPESEGSIDSRVAENSDAAALKDDSGEAEQKSLMMSVEEQTVPLVNEVTDDQTLITVGVKDEQVQIVFPVSFLHRNNEITKTEMLQDIISRFPEGEFGVLHIIREFKFEQITESEVKVIVPNNLTLSSPGQDIKEPIIETLRWMGYKKAQVVYEDGRQVEDAMSGGTVGPIEIQSQMKGYVIHRTTTNKVFLVPTLSPSTSFENALEIMSQPGFQIEPSIEQGLINNVIVEDKTVTVSFTKEIENSIQNDLMIKAILLSAKEFGYEQVKFENTVEQIGEYPLKDPKGNSLAISVPIAPNYMEIPNK